MKNNRYVLAANVIAMVHLPLAVVVIVFGQLWMSAIAHAATLIVIVFLQVACLGCPLSVLEAWLRRKGGQIDVNPSGLTFMLYDRFGPIIGIPIFILSVAASYATARIMLG